MPSTDIQAFQISNAAFAAAIFLPGADNNSVEKFDKIKKERGTISMSPKELLYIEDALGHTQYLMTQCRTAASQLTDPVLRQQAQQLLNGNQRLFAKFYELV